MARRTARTFLRGGRQVRESLWIGLGANVASLAAASSATILNSLNAAALALRPFTIVRSRGFFGIRSDQIAADENYDVALGFAVVSDQALAAGITAVPTPHTDIGSDLFYVYEALMGRFEFSSAVGIEQNLLTWVHYDSKAMRRVNDDQDISFVVETSAVSSGAMVHHSGRFLVKLH